MLNILKSSFAQILLSYVQFAGNGMYMLIFFISLLFIFVLERNNNTRIILCYYPVVLLTVIFNPLFLYLISAFVESIVYWRMFWMLPITCGIAYVASVVVISVSDRVKKVIAIVTLIAIFIMSGEYIFTKENYGKTTNWYKLPAQTIEVCEILEKDCDGVILVVVPGDLETTIRQYDANIQMIYGRDGALNTTVTDYVDRVAIYSLMHNSDLDVGWISQLMRKFECNYLVLNKSTVLMDDLEKYGYKYLDSTESYNIYRVIYD